MSKLSVKERIMETASRLFYYEGYNQTGINQIIEEAGVAKSSMYQCFRSKEDIAAEYLKRRDKTWMYNLEQFVSEIPSGKERIETAMDFLQQWLIDEDFRGCGFQNIITDLPKGQDKIAEQVIKHKNALLNWIEVELIEEYGSGKETELLASEIIVLIEGAIILTQIQKNIWPVVSAKEALKKILK